MNRQFRKWVADRLTVWAEKFQDWSEQIRPRPLEQYGPPTYLQTITRQHVDEFRRKWIEDLATQVTPGWPYGSLNQAKVGETLQIRLPKGYSVKVQQ